MIGEAIMTARVAKGMTQEDLAASTSLTQAALSRYEHDLREPDPEVLKRIADALGVTPELLKRAGRMEGGIAVSSHMRRRATAKATVWKSLEAQLNMVRLHATRLSDELSVNAQLQVPSWDPQDVPPDEAARRLRSMWRMPSGPVHSLSPWLDAAGILVVLRDFGYGSRVDGLSQWADGFPVMLINSTAPTDRLRMTLAHELGHVILHCNDVPMDAEKQANLFASELLMPAQEIRPSLHGLTIGRLGDLKRYWGYRWPR